MRLLGCCCCWRMAPNTRMTRKWEVFAGRNKFYCDGYLMTAPNTGIFYLTVFLITGTSALFFAFDCPYLTTHITSAIPIVGAILYVLTMGSLLRTTFTDPGVIPRALQDEAAYIEKQIEVPNSLNSPTYRPPPRTKEILVKGQTVKLKYCFTCKIFRPPRASHCSLCDNCVDRFDHHCPWVGNCVGKRNYRFFYMFIVSLAFLAVFIFSCSVTHLVLLGKDGDEEFIEIVKKAPFSVIVTLICFFSIWSVIGLAGFHTYLTTSDQTTNEDIKGSFSKGAQQIKNPYSHGNICSNCCYILCGPMTPSLIDRRGQVTEEYMTDMQPSDSNRFAGAPQSIVLQPMSNSTHIHKTKYYDNDFDNNLIASGKYRQRSYDNLKTGNSNSVANLVENENPTSMQSMPINDDMLPNVDTDTLDNLTPFNNMKGSYNNLFCDNIDEDTTTTIQTLDQRLTSNVQQQQQPPAKISAIDKSAQLLENVYCNISPVKQHHQSALNNKISNDNSASSAGYQKSYDDSTNGTNHQQNLVSPKQRMMLQGNQIIASTPQQQQQKHDSILNKSDPNLHVYSNVNSSTIAKNELLSPTMAPNSVKASNSRSSIRDVSSLDQSSNLIKSQLNGDNVFNSNIESMLNKSSKMLSDDLSDLDLDDPTVLTTGTGTISKVLKTNANALSSSNVNDRLNVTKKKSKVGEEIAPKGLFNESTASALSAIMENSGAGDSNSSYFSSQRMRSLHDNTMIDTALDLDSLEDASIGIGSPAC